MKILITEPSGSAGSIDSERKNRCRLLLKDEATELVVIPEIHGEPDLADWPRGLMNRLRVIDAAISGSRSRRASKLPTPVVIPQLSQCLNPAVVIEQGQMNPAAVVGSSRRL